MTTQQLSYGVTRLLAGTGAVVVAGLVAADAAWVVRWRELLLLVAVTLGLRGLQLSLGKYAYVSQVGAASLAGTLLIGPVPAALGVAAGTFFADWGWLRKDAFYAWVNAARELVTVLAAFGYYALALRLSGAPSADNVEALPAFVVLGVAYFTISRLLFYYSLVVRRRLSADDRMFLLRYEVVAYGLTVAIAAATVVAVTRLEVIAWPLLLAPVLLGTLLATRILEEAIEAEELNKISAMESAILSGTRLTDTLARLEGLAHRVLDWREFHVYRREGEAFVPLYRGVLGSPLAAGSPIGFEDLRVAAVESRRSIVIADAERDPRTLHLPGDIQSLIIEPLVFGHDVIGTFELTHHHRRAYRARDLLLARTCARRIATAVHIADLRRPLVETVERIGAQVSRLATLAVELREALQATTSAIRAIGGSLSEQDQAVATGLAETERLSASTRCVVAESRGAAAASGAASETAERHRVTIRGAIERLLDLKAFVAEGSARVGDLGTATERIVRFLESIRELADLTNLLALNAAIEAARAGRYGRGFAEVAREVRGLAEESAGAATEAGRLVEEMQLRLADVVQQMRRGQAQVEGVEETSTAGLAALEAVVLAAREATEHAQRIAETATGQQEAFVALRERIGGVAAITGRNRVEAEAVARGAAEVVLGVEQMARAARELDAVATMLSDLTRRFTAGNGATAF